MEEAKVSVFLETAQNGQRVLRVVAEHMTEEMKDKLIRELGGRASFTKVVEEECNLDLPTYRE